MRQRREYSGPGVAREKIRDSVAGCDRVEAEAYVGSPLCHQSGLYSDDPSGEDEVENVRPGHVEALGAACVSLESEGGVTGAAAFGTKRSRMPSGKISIARLYGWSSSGGFAEATCLEAEPGRGQLRITEDLVGGFTVVSCTSSPLTRRSAKPVGLGVVCTISTFGGRSPSPVLGHSTERS